MGVAQPEANKTSASNHTAKPEGTAGAGRLISSDIEEEYRQTPKRFHTLFSGRMSVRKLAFGPTRSFIDQGRVSGRDESIISSRNISNLNSLPSTLSPPLISTVPKY
jgi:hypothetical protein